MTFSSISSAIARFREPRPRLRGQQSIRLKTVLRSFSIGLLLPTFIIRPVLGAERLKFSYGLLEQSISINSLETYAKTGKVDDELSGYIKHSDKKNLPQLRQVLLTPIPLNVVQVSQFLYTPIGETLLAKLGQVIKQESRISGFYAIRAALILSAADPNGFTLLSVLRKFPSKAINIDLARSLEIANQFKNLVNQTQKAVALINQQSSFEATTTPVPTNASKTNLIRPGSFKWQKQTINLNDISRLRKFPADIYLPQAPNLRPVVVISHGLGSDRTSFAYLAEHLASYGFVVAVPEHPGSNAQQLQALLAGRAQEVTRPREFVDRPLDVKYLLDELTRLSQSNPAFQGHLNLQHIGVVGQSFGGYTALALAGAPINFQELKKNCPHSDDSLNVSLLLQCLAINLPPSIYNLSDARVKAAIAIDPVDSTIMGQASLSQIKIPVMIVAGSADTVAPALPEQIQPFTWLTTQNKYLALINGATHFSTIGDSPTPGAIPVPEQVIGSNSALARRYVNVLGLAFFQTYVAQQPNYVRYLGANYINTISRVPLTLSLVRSLSLPERQKTPTK
ncbi:MAG: alpha/beta hydrolase [Stigonema ocellatum SAG 48.90 = DSM 106950]|nr:alpha/beta hydrolase [Stigonema ocellatum SAG 48.90 = DSM 106950]